MSWPVPRREPSGRERFSFWNRPTHAKKSWIFDIFHKKMFLKIKKIMTFSHELACSKRRTLWEGEVLLLEPASSCAKVMDFFAFFMKK